MGEKRRCEGSRLLLLLLLSLLLVVLGMIATLFFTLPEEEKLGRISAEDAFLQRRLIVTQPTYKELDRAYMEGVKLLRDCDFMNAAGIFETLGDYADSPQKLSYCRYRLASEKQKIEDPWIRTQNHLEEFVGGNIYSAAHHGLIYVPKDCNADTRCLVYFAGGTGGNLLYKEGVWEYFYEFAPNAVMLFFYSSGFYEMDAKTDEAMTLLRQLEREVNITLHDMSLIGSSNGSYSALHAAARLFEEYGFNVNNAVCLDAGLEWASEGVPTEKEYESLAACGAELILFEQPGVGLDKEPVRKMVDAGAHVTIVECTDDDHDRISKNAYKYGVFSWILDEFETLPEDQYKVIKLS